MRTCCATSLISAHSTLLSCMDMSFHKQSLESSSYNHKCWTILDEAGTMYLHAWPRCLCCLKMCKRRASGLERNHTFLAYAIHRECKRQCKY